MESGEEDKKLRYFYTLSLSLSLSLSIYIYIYIYIYCSLFINALCHFGLCPSDKKMEGDKDLRTLECLRGRLLAERQASRLAKEDSERMGNKVKLVPFSNC